MKQSIILILVLIFLSSCKAIEVIKDKTVIDSTKNTSKEIITKHDSIYIYHRDSIFIKQKNDTVFIEKWNTKIERLIKRDTVIKIDTIYQDKKLIITEYQVETKTETIYVKWLFWLGLAIPVVLYIAYRLLRSYLKI
jgi:hypothetical protein